MKIGDPVDTIPAGSRAGKYAEIWKAFSKVPEGQYMPVEFKDSPDESRLFAMTARTKRGVNVQVFLRSTIVYLLKTPVPLAEGNAAYSARNKNASE
jgi:hypothetical protein